MRFLRSFHETFQSAVDYYAGIDTKLARRFIYAVEEAQSKIVKFPKIGRRIANGREFLLEVFPYGFCYLEDSEGEPLAVRLFHYRQKGPEIR